MFNYEALAVEKAKRAGAEAALAIAKELYERLIADRDKQISRLSEDLGHAHGKISLMETVVMPLSGKAGDAMADVLYPVQKPTIRPISERPTNEWLRYKQAKERELEAQYAAETAEGK